MHRTTCRLPTSFPLNAPQHISKRQNRLNHNLSSARTIFSLTSPRLRSKSMSFNPASTNISWQLHNAGFAHRNTCTHRLTFKCPWKPSIIFINHQSRLAGDVPFGSVTVVTVRHSAFTTGGSGEICNSALKRIYLYVQTRSIQRVYVRSPFSERFPKANIHLSLTVNAHLCFNQTYACFEQLVLEQTPHSQAHSANPMRPVILLHEQTNNRACVFRGSTQPDNTIRWLNATARRA